MNPVKYTAQPALCAIGMLKYAILFSTFLLFFSTFSNAQNPVSIENALPGNPSSEWDISGAGDLAIQGFATDLSINTGTTVDFKIDVKLPATNYSIKIYRLGYYGGNGARLVADLGNGFAGQAQPAPLYETATGKTDCSNWAVSASWTATAAVSGIYVAKITRADNNGSSHIVFVVRNDTGNSKILFKTSDATWQAYNGYGGNSFYVNNSGTAVPGFNHATKVSYNRPFYTRAGGGGSGSSEDWIFNAEYPMVRWMERNGYDVSYTTDMDMDRDATVITPSIHKVLLSVGHDEYWSLAERTKFETARNNGVHLAFFSGNEVYWKTRWEDNHRTLVCYKEGTMGENTCGGDCDPTNTWTGLWRDGCTSSAPDGCRPENALTGQISWGDATGSILVPDTYKNLRFWRNTSIATLGSGQTATLPNGTLGYEFDYEQYPANNPSGRILMSSTTLTGKTHKLSLYRHASGAWVFGAGTVQWSWGLDENHDRGNEAPSVAMQQATVNLFADMGVQPVTIQPGLVIASASTDNIAPVSVITTPANGSTVIGGANLTVSGTASDANAVGGVEVSIDGGSTWTAATGTSSWSINIAVPNSAGPWVIKSRAFDDNGNMETAGASGPNVISVIVTGRPSPNTGTGGPILVVYKSTNEFSRYTAEILRAQGLNEFDVKEIGEVNAGLLAAYDVVILGEMSLSGTDVSNFTNWVNAGGTFIAFKPDVQLSSLLGITATGNSLSNQYLLVNTANGPGAGIVNQTIQFHGAADYYNLNGATALATLYSNATTPTAFPAVTKKMVGTNGGAAFAFTYDLAKSIVYTRQGNPAWINQNRDGQSGPDRSNDLFFGNASGDPQPDWVNLDKVAIPQADEQQQLLTNIIIQSNLHRKPLPRFWFLPSGKKAAVVMTGDDHAAGGTIGRFNQYLTLSGSHNNATDVADWKAIRGSSYIFPNTPITNAQAAAYEAQGFEIGVHLNTGCANYTQSALNSFFATQLGTMATNFPGISATSTHRTHCIAWSGWSVMAAEEFNHGIYLDANYYYWPDTWVQNRPGMFTGSGMPMRFATLNGALIDCYQVATQLTDESGINYTLHINSLLDKATGPEGYYGVFCANMHTDVNGGNSTAGSDAIIAAAQSKNIPVVSAKQMLTWLDGRNSSAFTNLVWNNHILTFGIDANAQARNLKAMLPKLGDSSLVLLSINRNGNAVSFTTETIKGIEYAFFDAAAGNYTATYQVDNTGPVITNIVVTPGSGSAEITWTTDEASDSKVDYGTSAANLSSSNSNATLVTNHSITLTGLTSGTTYYFRVSSADISANSTTEPAAANPPLSFTMPVAPCAVDITAADFNAGTVDANTRVILEGDGAVSLKSAMNEEFTGAATPANWTEEIWTGGGMTTYNSGRVTVDGSHISYNNPLAPGASLEFLATFTQGDFQNIGFTGDAAFNSPWIVIGRGAAGSDQNLYARNSGNESVSLGSALLGSQHVYRIQWLTNGSFEFYVDGILIPTPGFTQTVNSNMLVNISDYPVGGASLAVDWIRSSPYSSSGIFTSRVFDYGSATYWGAVTWNEEVPANSSLAVAVRTGNTAVPDGSWSAFVPVINGGIVGCAAARYIQYKAVFTTTSNNVSPKLKDIAIACAASGSDITPPLISNITVMPNSNGTALITWSTNEASTSVVDYGTAANNLNLNSTDPALVINHSISLTGLTPGLTYYYCVSSADCSNNTATATIASFTVPFPVTICFQDQLTADFDAGTKNNTYITTTTDGEVILKPAAASEFSQLPPTTEWKNFEWNAGGNSTVSAGVLMVNGARYNSDIATPFGPGASMEFRATFGAATFQHIGFGAGTDGTGATGIYTGSDAWAMFSTANSTSQLQVRTFMGSAGATNINVGAPNEYIGTSHLYRIDWNPASIDFYIDGVLKNSTATTIGGTMRPAISDYNLAAPAIAVDWIHVSPYAASGSFTSRVFDAGLVKEWGAVNRIADVPANTSLAVLVRTGNTAVPDGSWSGFATVNNGDNVGSSARYIQYKADFTTTNTALTPVLKSIAFACSNAIAGSIGDRVWEDLNRDGIQDNGEPGISGAKVTLYDHNNNSIAVTTTNGSGNYVFNNLVTGVSGTTYQLAFTLPPGYLAFSPVNGGVAIPDNSDADATGRTVDITLTNSSPTVDYVDAGLYRQINISGHVWNDANGLTDFQINSTGAQPVPNSLYLYLVDMSTNLIVQLEAVNPDGTYNFIDVEINHSYRIVLSTVLAFPGEPAPISFMPQGWQRVGENLGAGPFSGSDGVNDGILYIDTETSNMTDANFGIRVRTGEIMAG